MYGSFLGHQRDARARSSGTGPSRPPTPSLTPSSQEAISHIPESENSVRPPVVCISDILTQPGRDHLTVLHPARIGTDTWFRISTNGITKAIRNMIHTQLEFPYPTYRSMPQQDRDLWFRTFAQSFNWDPTLTITVREQFENQAAYTYTRHINEWKRRWSRGIGRHAWISETLWKGFVEYWGSDTARRIASTNSKNRLSDRNGKGIATHNAGPKTFETIYRDMTIKEGKRPDLLEFMVKTHTSKKTNRIEDPKALELTENCKRAKTTAEEQLSQSGSNSTLSREEIDRLVIQQTPMEKGRAYGLGELALHDISQIAHHNNPVIVEYEAKLTSVEDKLERTNSELAKNTTELIFLKKMMEQKLGPLADDAAASS